jgi:hypothetical protein
MITEIERDSLAMKILVQTMKMIGGRTSPEGLPDKSGKPYWNLMKRLDMSSVQN